MKTLLAIIIALSLPVNTFAAECSQPVTLLQENTPAPCRGYLFTPEKELEVRLLKRESLLDKEELQALQAKALRLSKMNLENEAVLEKKDKQINLWKVRAEESTLKLVNAEEGRQTRDLLFIGAGVLLTVLAGWALGQVK